MSTLLSPALTKRLSNFSLTTKQTVRGGHKGERKSSRLGSSLEFSDYRLYSPGDDLRQIDWNTYARTEKYYIKRFLDEQELPVSVYLDCTKSMGIHEDKWLRAKQMAAVFTFLSLANADRLSVRPVASPNRAYPYTKGKAMTRKVMDYIEDMSLASGDERFGTELIEAVHQSRQGSFNIVISDFLEDPSKLFTAMKKMQAKRQQILLVQVVLPEEKNPGYTGDLKLIDVESSGERDISMNPRVNQQYQQRFDEHIVNIQSFCNKRGIDFVQCLTSEQLEETIFSSLMKKGWIGR